ncbi:hypothetical protein PGTUg99_003154 [Puccinia graminis f. sp. tritici]|uniref:Uncharacterized protein n=1 Tax=Puccinia graminis f. sp. tritici TaxID=56615 RepID=A0A5B0RWF4_PUCGR|nr:hypothetical protein PGTUg99_001541 [Puccinia graminis f. sp. tritici]KAA1129782.1 hypothetical protein PGTUg99_003154 [Puccinia graminis f. sp. tritici]
MLSASAASIPPAPKQTRQSFGQGALLPPDLCHVPSPESEVYDHYNATRNHKS